MTKSLGGSLRTPFSAVGWPFVRKKWDFSDDIGPDAAYVKVTAYQVPMQAHDFVGISKVVDVR